MRASIVVVLCLSCLAMAAEDKSDRKSRQILHPPLVHGGRGVYSLGHQPHHLPAVQYVQPAVHGVALPQPLHLSGPQVFSGHHYPSAQYNYIPQLHHYPQPVPQAAFPFGRRFQPIAPVSVSNVQFDQSPRGRFQQSNTPSQNFNEEQNFQSGSQLSQNFRGNPSFSQSQASVGQTAYGPSPRFQTQSQPNMPYPSDASNSQASSQPLQNQQQTRAFFPGSFDQRSSSPAQGSQQGQIRSDGSYNFGFQSANGIQRTESSEVRPGLYRYEQRSYSH